MILALVGGAPGELGPRLVAAMRDGWIATYAVGFGPPLVGANEALKARLAGSSGGAFDKLVAYCDCVLVPERARMTAYWKHRARLRSDDRAEISRRSVEAIDLTMRLHHPATAPARVVAEMVVAGLDTAAMPAVEALEARLLVRIEDPFGAALSAQVALPAEETDLVLELVIDPRAATAWQAWAARLPGTRAVYLNAS